MAVSRNAETGKVVGDEIRQPKNIVNTLGGGETLAKIEQNQCPTFEGVSLNLVESAARWLVENRDKLTGPTIPILRERFGLRNLEAIEATKLAHAIEFGRAG